jgi:RNA polymerase sigma-70 factor (family 1)
VGEYLDINKPYEENELLLRIAKDDAEAFAQLYDHYWNRIYSLARVYLKSSQTAEDLVQEIFLKIWSGRKTLGEVRSFRPFLLVMARNMIISHLRKTVFLYELGDEDYTRSAEDFLQPDHLLTLKESALLLQEAVDSLPAQQKRAYRLSRDSGKSYAEIAQDMQISPLTVRTHISQALAFLRRYLHSCSLPAKFLMLLLSGK